MRKSRREIRRKKLMKKRIETAICGFCGIMLLWCLLSWADVVAHNMVDQSYAWWNVIALVFQNI